MILLKKHQKSIPIPFGPFLCFAGLIYFFYGYKINHLLLFDFCYVAFLSRSVCVRACVRARRFHLSDHHWKQALVALVPTRNFPASCPHAYLSRIESSRANRVQRQRRRTPVHVEGGPTGWAAPAAQSDCAHGCTIARLVPARDHPQTRIWSGTAHSVRILDAPGSQADEFNEKHNGPNGFR